MHYGREADSPSRSRTSFHSPSFRTRPVRTLIVSSPPCTVRLLASSVFALDFVATAVVAPEEAAGAVTRKGSRAL